MARPLDFPLPAGMRDWLPGEAARKRELENALAELFRSWSYREVSTPALEFYTTVLAGGLQEEEQIWKLIDRQGKILALRPDMTMPVARLAATRLAGEKLPLRLFYLAPVFRWEEPQAGRQREFSQAGVELLGAQPPRADAEVIALAVEALRRAGLAGFRVGVGHAEVVRRTLAALDLPPQAIEAARRAVGRKDLVGLEELLERYGVSPGERERVAGLCLWHGTAAELPRARELAGEAAAEPLAELSAVLQALEACGLAASVFVDLGIVRDLDYYNGVVFEGYAAGLGFPVCGGGRYDGLLSRFGRPCPATGFALGLERVLLAQGNGHQAPEGAEVFLAGPDYPRLLQEAAALRADGIRVEVDAAGLSLEEAAAYAAARGIADCRWLEGGAGGA